jgi:hypothetical protein
MTIGELGPVGGVRPSSNSPPHVIEKETHDANRGVRELETNLSEWEAKYFYGRVAATNSPNSPFSEN